MGTKVGLAICPGFVTTTPNPYIHPYCPYIHFYFTLRYWAAVKC